MQQVIKRRLCPGLALEPLLDGAGLGDRDHIAIAELACHEPGCPDLETVVTVTLADRRRFVLRFPSAVAAVTKADVALLGPQVPAR